MDAWRTIDGRLQAWFATPSHAAGAALLPGIVAIAGRVVDVDVRSRGVRVRLDRDDASLAPAISAAAEELGLSPAPEALQALRLVVETPDPDRAAPFWALVLGYERHGTALHDPWRRDLSLLLEHDRDVRPLRDRVHVDVVRPAAAVASVVDAVGLPTGPYGLRHADPDGIEVDAVPGEPLAGAEDWWTIFAAVARYATTTEQAVALAQRAATLADEAGDRVGIDVRPGSVTLDGGKDAWEDEDGARPAFVTLAARIQRAAHDLGATPLPADLRFVQLGFDAVDVAGSRAIWRALLGAERDPREHVTDLVDPRGIGHVLFLQPMDASEHDRRAQRPRVRVEVLVPADAMAARLEAIVAAGGRVLEQHFRRATVGDADGAIAVVVAS